MIYKKAIKQQILSTILWNVMSSFLG